MSNRVPFRVKFFFCAALGLQLFVVGALGCEAQGEPTLQEQTTPELPGTIVCYEPWGAAGSQVNLASEVVYRGTVSNWGGHPIHTTAHAGARLSGGAIVSTAMTVRFNDDNGNRVFLLNYPCRITLPPRED